jgi:ferredoxin-2, mitochondrial
LIDKIKRHKKIHINSIVFANTIIVLQLCSYMEKTVTIQVEDRAGNIKPLEIPTDMSLNLMEALKGEGYDIEATCGGMALCATCHIKVKKGLEQLHDQSDAELDMLDTLPVIYPNSRLSCQIHVSEEIDGLEIQLA